MFISYPIQWTGSIWLLLTIIPLLSLSLFFFFFFFSLFFPPSQSPIVDDSVFCTFQNAGALKQGSLAHNIGIVEEVKDPKLKH